MESTGPQSSPPAEPGHEILGHTADVGLRAWGPDLASVFEEAAGALAELSADPDVGAGHAASETVTLQADDLVALAYGWLNELIGLIDIRGPLLRVTLDEVAEGRSEWRLRARVGLLPWDRASTSRRLDLKSATYHRLSVARIRGGWLLTAYLDV